MTNIQLNLERTLFWFDEVNRNQFNRITMELVRLSKIDKEKPIHLFIETNGGSCSVGFAFFELVIEVLRLNLITVALGDIASAGLIIFASGKEERLITKRSYGLLHELSRRPEPDPIAASEMSITAGNLNITTERYAKIISESANGKVTEERIVQIMKEGKNLSAEELIKEGIATGIYQNTLL